MSTRTTSIDIPASRARSCSNFSRFSRLLTGKEIKLNRNFVKDIVNVLSDLKLYNSYLVQISSGGVYGKHLSNVIKPWEERDELNPLSVYATSKVEGEKEALAHKGPVLILRSDFYGLNNNRKRFTLLSWIIYNIENNIKMEGWENIYFSPISAFKLCKTIDQCITSNVTGIFNVGSEDGCNKFDFVEAVGKIINKKVLSTEALLALLTFFEG